MHKDVVEVRHYDGRPPSGLVFIRIHKTGPGGVRAQKGLRRLFDIRSLSRRAFANPAEKACLYDLTAVLSARWLIRDNNVNGEGRKRKAWLNLQQGKIVRYDVYS